MINLYYLGQPYADPNEAIRVHRYQTACRVTAAIMKSGRTVFSPIVHNHILGSFYDLPRTWDFWSKIDLTILERCDGLYVLPLKGWSGSVGLTDEVQFAFENDIPIWFIDEMGVTGGQPQSFEEYKKLARDIKDAK